jgi:phenylacetic acid degradation operon negative regulatory protein
MQAADRNASVKQSLGEAVALVRALASSLSPRAGSFIVTLYGDVVEPRGLQLWMGHIIEICAMAGISETLVRTAVSRLVASGRLVGDRQGRRSYYRLTDDARLEFAHAARILFEPSDAQGWRLVWSPGEASARLEKVGFIKLGGAWMIGPADQASVFQLPEDALMFEALPFGSANLPKMVASEWDFAGWDAAYQQFLYLFEPLSAALGSGQVFDDPMSLQLRLFLVHAYRLAALRDPHLPREALPASWSGAKARALFASLYLRLSPGADRYAGTLQSVDGDLPSDTPILQRRRETLLLSQKGG